MSSEPEPSRRPWQAYQVEPEFPVEGELEHLAHRILGMKDPTRGAILCRLREGRRGHAQLERELGCNPGLVHRALRALEQDGLVLQQVDARQKPVTRSYRLTPSGGLVVELIERFQAAADRAPLELTTETGTYILYSREVTDEAGHRQRQYFFSRKGTAVTDARPESSPLHHRVIVPHASAPVLE